MMKRSIATLLLALLLLCGCCAAAAAADTAPQQSEQVTLAVKKALSIGDDYSDFYIETAEEAERLFYYLNWSNEQETLQVTADGTGKIYNFYRTDNGGVNSYEYGRFTPRLPKGDRAAAQQAAEAFLAAIAGTRESFVIYEQGDNISSREMRRISFFGSLSVNELPTPIGFSLSVDAAEMRVNSFSRDDLYMFYSDDLSKLTLPTKLFDADKAAALLKTQLQLRLQYALGDDGKTATLQYLPLPYDEQMVDAVSGQLFSAEELFKNSLSGRGDAVEQAAAAEDSASFNSLSGVEKAGVEQIEGTLSKEQLDTAIRAISELKLGRSFTLQEIRYAQDQDNDRITATLIYSAKADAATLGASVSALKWDPYISKTVTVNAVDGQLLSLYTSYPYLDTLRRSKTRNDLQSVADSFAATYAAERYTQTALADYRQEPVRIFYDYDSLYAQPSHRYDYEQQVNGYPYAGNAIHIAVNANNGAVDSFYIDWNEDIEFAAAAQIVDEQAALDAYAATFACQLSYTNAPTGKFNDYYGYIYTLKPVYTLTSDDYCYAIDAVSGQPLFYAESAALAAYDDIASSYARTQIETLAAYGVGFTGSSFRPAAQLTELDMLTLLISATGSGLIDDAETLYMLAADYGLFSGAQQPQRAISRQEYIKTIIAASGYGQAAGLNGIYRTGFADDWRIGRDYYGYVAIAKGMGMIGGDQYNRCRPADTATRAEAAVILYNYMNRSI
ncbi:MAG: hypothetical protein Q4B96_05455 [Bacillota bacterium]|nr:hypothetical protein [Bacillota bacterium]